MAENSAGSYTAQVDGTIMERSLYMAEAYISALQTRMTTLYWVVEVASVMHPNGQQKLLWKMVIALGLSIFLTIQLMHVPYKFSFWESQFIQL